MVIIFVTKDKSLTAPARVPGLFLIVFTGANIDKNRSNNPPATAGRS